MLTAVSRAEAIQGVRPAGHEGPKGARCPASPQATRRAPRHQARTSLSPTRQSQRRTPPQAKRGWAPWPGREPRRPEGPARAGANAEASLSATERVLMAPKLKNSRREKAPSRSPTTSFSLSSPARSACPPASCSLRACSLTSSCTPSTLWRASALCSARSSLPSDNP